MNYREIEELLKTHGWFEDRQKSSHHIFKHAMHKETIAVPDHGKKDLGKGLVNKILKMAAIKKK